MAEARHFVLFSFQLIPMLDIKEVYPEFQKMNKTENCIVIQLKSDQKIAITSPVSTGNSQFMREIWSENSHLKSKNCYILPSFSLFVIVIPIFVHDSNHNEQADLKRYKKAIAFQAYFDSWTICIFSWMLVQRFGTLT